MMIRRLIWWPFAAAMTVAPAMLGGCATGAGGYAGPGDTPQLGELHDDWLHSQSGPFPYSWSGGGGGGGRDAGSSSHR